MPKRKEEEAMKGPTMQFTRLASVNSLSKPVTGDMIAQVGSITSKGLAAGHDRRRIVTGNRHRWSF